jgi:acetate kinase
MILAPGWHLAWWPRLSRVADALLTINAGSSSIKFALFEANEALPKIVAGAIENIGEAPRFYVEAGSDIIFEKIWPHGELLSHEDLLTPLLDWVEQHLGESMAGSSLFSPSGWMTR